MRSLLKNKRLLFGIGFFAIIFVYIEIGDAVMMRDMEKRQAEDKLNEAEWKKRAELIDNLIAEDKAKEELSEEPIDEVVEEIKPEIIEEAIEEEKIEKPQEKPETIKLSKEEVKEFIVKMEGNIRAVEEITDKVDNYEPETYREWMMIILDEWYNIPKLNEEAKDIMEDYLTIARTHSKAVLESKTYGRGLKPSEYIPYSTSSLSRVIFKLRVIMRDLQKEYDVNAIISPETDAEFERLMNLIN